MKCLKNAKCLGVFVIVSVLALLFQNCVQPKTEESIKNGTTTGNPFQSKLVTLNFEAYNSAIQNPEMCLTNIVLRFDSPETILSTAVSYGGFDVSYFYYLESESKYYINGLLKKKIQLHDDGTPIGQFELPMANYDRIIFGFSSCEGSSSVTFENSNGQFSDDPTQVFAIKYDNPGVLSDQQIFPINFFTDSLATVASDAELAQILQPYRSFDLIGFTGTPIADHKNVVMKKLANQSTGKTIAVGNSLDMGNYSDLIISRYLSDGSLDSSFGNSGISIVHRWGIAQHIGVGAAVAPDDSIFIVTSLLEPGGGGRFDITVIKLDRDGKIDSSFGSSGWQGVHGSGWEYGYDIHVANDGSIFVLGVSEDRKKIVTAKLNSDGSLDRQYGNDGISEITYKLWGANIKMSLQMQPDGKLLIATGSNEYAGTEFLILRLTADGDLDTTFNASSDRPGMFVTGFKFGNRSYAWPSDICLQPDGKIVSVGRVRSVYGEDENITALRLSSSGELDTSFANNGKFTYDFGGFDKAESCIIDNQGKVIIGASTNDTDLFSFAILILNSSGQLNIMPGDSGIRLFNLSEGAEGRDMIVRSDGNYYFGGSDDKSFNLLTISP